MSEAARAVRAGRRREGKQKRRGRGRMRKRTGYLPAAGSAGSFFEKYVEKWDGLKKCCMFYAEIRGKKCYFHAQVSENVKK